MIIPAQRQRGFSLMEIMVALVIFSMISVGAFGVLTALQRSQRVLEEHSAQLETLQRVVMMSRHDISQAAPHALPFTDAQPQPASYVQMAEAGPLVVVSLNWRNPLEDSRSTLAVVRYTMEGDLLLRQIWPFAASTEPAATLRQVLADHLQAIRFRGVTTAAVKPAAATTVPKPTLPGAIEMTVTLPPFGEVRQLIPLVQTP